MHGEAWRTVIPGLQARYRESHRAYHNLAHIEDLLRLMHELGPLVADPRAFEMAIWFHDAVYDPKAHDNEKKSAELVRPSLTGLTDESTIARVEKLVLATDGHVLPKEGPDDLLSDIAHFLDADLSSLGAPPAIFDRNSTNIRKEYAHVPEDDFKLGRASVLRRFLDRRPLYMTPWFRERYEAQARENLTRGLREIGHAVA